MKAKLMMMVIAGALVWACGTSNSNDSTTQADSANEAVADSAKEQGLAPAVAEDDAEFAVEAANGGMVEVQLGELSQSNGMDPKVKEFGQMMVSDHSKANDELKALAADKGIVLPATLSDEKQKLVSDMGSKKGKEFDKAYVKEMVKDHEKDVKLFEDAQKDVKDADIKAFIDKTLPVLKKHLDHIKALDKAK